MFTWESLGVEFTATTTSLKIYVASLISDDITLNGVTKTPVAKGTDRGSNDAGGVTAAGNAIAASQIACYVAVFEITGLAADTTYTYTVSQASASITITPKTLVSAGTDHSVFFLSCNRQGDHSDTEGMYGYIKYYEDNGEYPVSAIIHNDDTVYADTVEIDDTASGFTGKSSTNDAATSRTVHDYLLPYLANLGLFGDSYQAGGTVNDFNNINGHASARKWCYRSIPQFKMWGDHEFNNDVGFDSDAQGGLYWTAATGAWDALYGAIMPAGLASTSDHTEGQHYSVTIGDLHIGLLDGISMGDGTAAANGTLLGATQISEMVADFNASTSPFNVLSTGNGIRNLHATLKTIDYGANNCLSNNVVDEYASLITATGAIQSVWNSAPGFVVCGDYHNSYVYKHEETTLAVIDESFVELGCGTCNGSQNHNLDGTITVGVTINNATALYVDPSRSSATYDYSCVRVDVLGSGATKKIRASLIDKNWNTVWSGEWQDGMTGNLPTPYTMKKI